MGLVDNFREFFSGLKNTQKTQIQDNDEYEKTRLANKIVSLVSEIKRINSFDSSLWNLSNISSYELNRKSLDELKRINDTLENRISEISKQNQRNKLSRESLEACKWTGQKPENMSDHDFDRFQRSDDYR